MSIVNELKFKMFRSGSRMYLFIGINILIFLIIGITGTFQKLFTGTTTAADWMEQQLAMPAFLPELPYRIWTVVTYMFSHRDLFHIVFNLLWLYWMGRIFEDFLNKRQFTFTYFAGGLAGALFFILAYNVFPVFSVVLPYSSLIGASASVMAIVVATATLLPDYSINLLFFGSVRLKYLAVVYVLLDIIAVAGKNPGGSFAHLGGAALGYIYIVQLRRGNDWSKLFHRKPKLRPIRNEAASIRRPASELPDQDVIDEILDKISRSGYDSLTKAEKEQLFRASNKKE
ncbi:MAG TPA: rhomboid family intramembrane serine protease [Sphingobacteriaceae bacterium]